MVKAGEVAKAALQLILVQGSEASFEADEYQDFLFAMNNFMADLESQGVKLGYTMVDTLNDPITIPRGAVNGLIANMAVLVAPEYGGVVTDTLVQQAVSGMRTMRILGQRIPRSRYPATLPRGSGSEQDGAFDTFYPGFCDKPV